MQDCKNYIDLSGKALVASPTIRDPRFVHSVIVICTHNENGTLGLIINKQTKTLNSRTLLDDLDIKDLTNVPDFPVHIGGPVAPNSGFILHPANHFSTENSLPVTENLYLTSSPDILSELDADNHGQKFILALGYTGWRPGQLEDELLEAGWVVTQADADFVFSDRGEDEKWHSALQSAGINVGAFSPLQGTA